MKIQLEYIWAKPSWVVTSLPCLFFNVFCDVICCEKIFRLPVNLFVLFYSFFVICCEKIFRLPVNLFVSYYYAAKQKYNTSQQTRNAIRLWNIANQSIEEERRNALEVHSPIPCLDSKVFSWNIRVSYAFISSLKIYCFINLKIVTGKPTGKRPLGRPRRRWEDNIRMDLRYQ